MFVFFSVGEDDEEKAPKPEEEEAENKKEEEKEEKIPEPSLYEVVKGELNDLRQETRQLHNLVTQLHQRHHEHTLRVSLSYLRSGRYFFALHANYKL